MLAVALAAGVSGLSAAPALAQEADRTVRNAADLARFCGMPDKAFCFGYLNGAGQFYEALVTSEEVDIDPFVCPDEQIREEEGLATFLDWLERNPDARDSPAIDALFRAWVDAFPCE
jgi:hypothetical protein